MSLSLWRWYDSPFQGVHHFNKIKAQNAAKKADEVLNNKLSDSSEEENISLDEKKDDEDPSDSYTGTIGSDGKPTRRKRNAKSTISIITK